MNLQLFVLAICIVLQRAYWQFAQLHSIVLVLIEVHCIPSRFIIVRDLVFVGLFMDR